MRIIETKDWLRRDFNAVMECEGCGEKEEVRGCYDDNNYYNNVIPARKCKKCGKSSNDLGSEKIHYAPKYPSELII